MKSPTNPSGLGGAGRPSFKNASNVEQTTGVGELGNFAPVEEAQPQMEETWKKTSGDQVLMVSDSDMDPHEFSAQNRGKFTERSQKSPLRALYEAGDPVVAEEDIGLERVTPGQESSGAAFRDTL